METSSNKTAIECQYCKKNFSFASNLYRHVKTVHKTSMREELNPVKCKEPGCDFACRIMEKLIDHLCTSHNMDMEYSIHEFSNEKDYKDWKIRLEKHTRSNYIQLSGTKKSKLNVNRTYFYCNRSGKFKPKGTGQRKLKETIKIGGHCTSHFILTEYANKIEVKFCKTHYGHTCGIQHVQLKKKEKRLLSTKMNQGASITNILDTVRDNLSNEFKQMKDLANRLTGNVEFNVFDLFHVTYENSEAAITSWVDSVKTLKEYNPVKFFKPRGIVNQNLQLDIDDFVLLVVTKLQEKLLKKIQNNLLCVDKIVENGELGLICVLVTNNEGHAIPVAYFISNKQDKKMFRAFFQLLKNVAGEIRPKSLMVEDTDVVLTMWKSVMVTNEDVPYVISPWKVDQTWRENLGQLSEQYTQAAVYKTIKALHTEICIERFNILLNECLKKFASDSVTEDFGNYFKHFYAGEPRTWAYCYHRIDEGNIFLNLESTRNALQNVFTKAIETNQMERVMVALLKMFRDSFQNILVKFMKDEGFLSRESIQERHEMGLKLLSKITQLTSNTWTIVSECNPGMVYTLELATEICSCQIRCHNCSICVHTYLCSCPESLNKFGLCQHVHYLVDNLRENTNVTIETMDDSLEVETNSQNNANQPPHQEVNSSNFENASCSQTLSDLQAQMDTIESLEKCRNEALNEINNLIRAVQNSNRMESINMALKEVKSILSLATSVENDDERPPQSPSEPIITLEEEPPMDLNKNDVTSTDLRGNYAPMPEIIDVSLSNTHLNENNQGIVTCPPSLPTENVLETAMGSIVQDVLNEESEIMIINEEDVDLCGLGKNEEVSTNNKDDACSQESVMAWLQSDANMIEMEDKMNDFHTYSSK